MRHVGVIDIGKTNAKVAVVDIASRSEIAVKTTPNTVLTGPPWPHFDADALWSFFLDSLRDLHARHRIDALVVTTHGACAALLTARGDLAAPVLDYEHYGPDTTAAAYEELRPDFAETGSPRLPMGLNLGAQLHWMFQTDPGLLSRTAHILTWPQYWGYRLTGRMACDVTSLGCHTDLWDPQRRAPSSLVGRLRIADKLGPVLAPVDRLGTLSPDVALVTGLALDIPVAAGIHDSNASLFPHLLDQPPPFAVVSTGTWVIAMAVGGDPVTLDPARDTLINVNAFGQAVPSARFMGGREYDLVMQGQDATPTQEDAAFVRTSGLMLLPSLRKGSGPFPDATSRWTPDPDPSQSGQKQVAVSYYLALMTAECLKMIGAAGPVIVEGPFARNADYVAMLATATGRDVLPSSARTGTAIGAALLFAPDQRDTPAPDGPKVQPNPDLAFYARGWLSRAES
jgi:sugar (pentulose or hexulose) kinase